MRRRTIAPRHSRRLCAAAGTVPSPFLDGRESVTLTSHAYVCKTSEGPKANRKQTAHAVAPSLSHTLADCAWLPVQPHHRFSMKICPIDRRRHDMGASVGETGYPRSANCPCRRAIALPHSLRLCAAAGAAPHHRFSVVQNLSHRPPAHDNMDASIGVTGYPRSANCPRRRAIALPHSRQLCEPAGTVPCSFLDVRNRSHRIPASTCVQASV